MNGNLEYTRDQARGWLAQHVVEPRVSLAWTVHSNDEQGRYRSAYAYSITWTPGSLFLAGDLGDLAVKHWHAFGTISNSVKWVRDADFSYFMSKTDVDKVLDPKATAAELRRALYERGRDLIRAGQLSVSNAKPPLPANYRLHTADLDALIHDWVRVESFCDCSGGLTFFPTRSTRAAVRRDLADAISQHGPDRVAELCSELGMDDYYGTFEYPNHSMVHFQAFKRWAELMGQTAQPQPVGAAA